MPKEWIYIVLLVPSFCVALGSNDIHAAKDSKDTIGGTILDQPSCTILKNLCNPKEKDDLAILECVATLQPQQVQTIGDSCQHIVWEHTSALIEDDSVKSILLPLCRNDMDHLPCDTSKGYFKCFTSNKDQIENEDCKEMVLKLEAVAFTDYQFIASFLQECTGDIKTLQCGKIDAHGAAQLETVSCLQRNILKVTDSCKKEVFKLTELQSDNIRLDHEMYNNCAEDHSRYCSEFAPGSGKVFQCLARQNPRGLSEKCIKSLNKRKKMISQDYKVSKGLMRACRDDIKRTHCRRQTSSDKNIRLAQILLCLENIARNGSRISSDCEAELVEHRRMLMEDYRLSPEIVDSCKQEISYYCNGMETGGKTIHCLMDRARSTALDRNAQFNEKCYQALGNLVKETDVAENWQVDPVLHKACSPVVSALCNDLKSGEARVMNCLMDHIGSDRMTEECEDAVMQIQYFVARKFELDPYLYGACKQDASNLCMEKGEWDHEHSPQVLPCLYRYFNPADNEKGSKSFDQPTDDKNTLSLSPGCARNIRRVMRQRAISVDLEPTIEQNCIADLAFFCHDKVKRGEEMLCLQQNYNDLEDDDCKKTIAMFTEFQAEHADLNPYINKFCGKVIKTLCSAEAKNDEGDVMECLIAHKNDMLVKQDPACRGSIEHFQLISLNDYRFSYKFKTACKPYAMRFCGSSKTKNEVVRCLSEQVLNATIHGVKGQVSRECKQQLKSQLFQQRESISLDPVLNQACQADIRKYCSHIENEHAQVLECLQTVSGKLTNKCEKEVFKVKKQELYDNSVDYALKSLCEDEIEEFCPKYKMEHVLECLRKNKNEKGFDKKCRAVVMHRIIEQNSNYQLNPSLQENCHMDINKFCKNVLQNHHEEDADGVVIKCLKEQFRRSRLSNKCEKEMTAILREQAMDINLNPLIRAVCSNELKTICKFNEDEDTGDAEECLKDALLSNRIQTPECKEEVANMIEESQADIHVDPILHRTCSIDLLTYCSDVPQGNGRLIKCLTTTLDSNAKLSPPCKNMLKKRIEMYRNAAQMISKPEDLSQLYGQVVMSPSKQYFFLVLMAVTGTIFLTGIMCGRLNKRKYMLLKSK